MTFLCLLVVVTCWAIAAAGDEGQPFLYEGQPFLYEGQPFLYEGQPFLYEGQPFLYEGQPFLYEGQPFMYEPSRGRWPSSCSHMGSRDPNVYDR